MSQVDPEGPAGQNLQAFAHHISTQYYLGCDDVELLCLFSTIIPDTQSETHLDYACE